MHDHIIFYNNDRRCEMNEKIIDLRELFSKMALDNSEFLNFFDLRTFTGRHFKTKTWRKRYTGTAFIR